MVIVKSYKFESIVVDIAVLNLALALLSLGTFRLNYELTKQ